MSEENNLNWFHVIVGAIITFIVALSFVVQAQAKECSKMCDPARSRPCGNSCISKFNKCRKSWTTACVGTKEENEVDGQSFFSNPTHKDPEVQK